MSAKQRTEYLCSACGHRESKWLGRCPQCSEWNTMEEQAVVAASRGTSRRGGPRPVGGGSATGTTGRSPQSFATIDAAAHERVSTGMAELDRVLGGGMVPGATVLVGGEPGIGKSTLMLQMAAQMRSRRVLYVTGEESPRQIKLRGDRLGVSNPHLEILAANALEDVIAAIGPAAGAERHSVVVIDSIQTIYSQEAGSVPGTPNQIKYATFEIAEIARAFDVAVFFVAHVTKEGAIAGPKTIEHMVDTVLSFEQSDDDTRYLRALKNRFGSTDEVGLFTMQPKGLVQITDPNSVFLVRRSGALPTGVVVTPVIEGSRVLLVEVQALTVPAKGGISRVYSERIDSARVSRMAAVLEKHLGVPFSDHDIYVNVAGGIRINDVGVELALAVALYSARTDRPFPPKTTVTGEVSLAGEIRPIPQMLRRYRAGTDLGFDRCVGPSALRQGEESDSTAARWAGADSLADAIARVMPAREKKEW
ncbi:MAG: DNA repair protein RadA [Spirochaetaceae bacterium]|nr:MAG: DNA repair protein RadA [Spirochaetaceae bacterium]